MMKPFPPATKWIFLDLDNTLWDFDTNANEALKALFQKHNLHLHCNYQVDQFISLYQDVNAAYWKRYERGEVSKEVLRTARFTDTFDAMGIPIGLQPNNVWEEYLDICPKMTRLMPNALKSLKRLSERFKLGVLTNGFELTQQTKIKASGMDSMFDFMVTSESLGVAKPALEFFNFAMNQANCTSDEVVYIGDTWDTDVEGGMAAGMITYWYRRGQELRSSNHGYFGGVVEDLASFAEL